MCGRYTLAVDPGLLRERFGFTRDGFSDRPRYNIAPTQDVPVVYNDASGRRTKMMRWGLLPFWAKRLNVGANLINARAETIGENSTFRQAFHERRCLVIADGFYEWRKDGNRKKPMRIMLKSAEPFAFAGVWSRWLSKEGTGDTIYSCSIITTVANSLLKLIHDRMPVILTPDSEETWLDPECVDAAELRELLVPYPAAELMAYEVSSLVNSPRNEDPGCILSG